MEASTTPRMYLAPLADFTDAPMRVMALAGGADGAYTEMVSAAALAHGHNPTRILLETLPEEKPPVCQIFGAEECDVAFASREIEKIGKRFSALNLNAGCPMAKVTRSGAGAALVKSPDKVHRLLAVMRENTSLPITLKTRLGPNPQNPTIYELIDAAASAGAAEIVVHARFTSQLHGGETHLDILADVVKRSPIPVVGNGSIVDAATAEAMASTGVAGLMIGRAALSRPWIFDEIRGGDGASRQSQTAFRRHLELLVKFHSQLLANLAPSGIRVPSLDAFVALKARTHLFRYFSGIPGAAALRARFNTVHTLDDVVEIV